jgi:endonuclease/exonuclease/phosphatase family metal-dependent hydrolase
LFNSIGLSEVFLDLRGEHPPTYPSRYPVLKLDRIYARGLEPRAGDVLKSAPWDNLSDHSPLYAELLMRQDSG